MHVVRLAHATLLFVDLESHTLFQEPPNRCHDALAGSFAAHEDVCIVGIADKSETAPVKLPIQFVEDDVGQQR